MTLLLHGIDQPYKLLGSMGYGNIAMLALSPLLGKVSSKCRIPKADIQRVTQLAELTPEIVHEFIEKIVVSKPEYRDGKRHQNLEIYYNGVGIVREPTPEEMEELFQEHLMNRKSEKTA